MSTVCNIDRNTRLGATEGQRWPNQPRNDSPPTKPATLSRPPNSPIDGFIAAGTVTRRYTRCTSPGCRCNADPPRPHGPYYQWTAKVDGKTVTRRLTPDEARHYQTWIANDRRLRAIITKMRRVAAKATNLIINNTAAS